MKTANKIPQLLKQHGPQTSQQLAQLLDMTSMAARKHLLKLQQEGLVADEHVAEAVGRPKQYWTLTEQGQQMFPQRYGALSLQLIEGVTEVFGAEGLNALIKRREQQSMALYQAALAPLDDIGDKLNALAQCRTEEGYMATVYRQGEDWWLVEMHCPICEAAKVCQGFCQSELECFQGLFKGVASVTRDEYLLDGAARCSYRVRPL